MMFNKQDWTKATDHQNFGTHPSLISYTLFCMEDQVKWNRILKAVDILSPSTLFSTHLKFTFKLANAN